ncbi:tetratricopeptide repeat-containing serine/threonine-protein kinase [Streptomyces sp. WAC00469]|uniref:serine/threonine-protein kinase n=1 Tax=Streptomyces sp. WAC00469 TaxID=2487415 RepID=UPI000F7397C9|nr:tetratricopeptide repeat-containing serine/threonine-protein kinase [Streptomyces sp. WAC00469]RSR97866.1 serine/threonine protein kinase [Streptomyces sp. WAC00469]
MADIRLIQGRYRLLAPIGRGGMGEVWRARDEALGRQVAVKCLKPLGPHDDRSGTRVVRERFRREAQVAAALQHRGVTVVHDFGECDGVLYLVMELLDGRDLSRLMEDNRHRPLPVADVVDIGEQIAAALDYTHRRGIVHRDLKPANIVRLSDGTVKICDFGIARLGRDTGFTTRLTGTGIAMGTPHYMSPEQIAGREVDRRSDLYALGCVLYELATGTPPFGQGDPWAVLLAHRDTPPPPPRRHRADLPGPLEQLILDLLAKSPEQRPGDAREVARRLTAARTTTAVPAAAAAEHRLPARPGPGATDGPPAVRRTGARLPSWTRHLPAEPAGDQERTTSDDGGRDAPAAETLRVLADRHRAALDLGRRGRWAEAGTVLRTVTAERTRLLGADHPETLAARYQMAFTLSRTGRPADALREYKHVARARIRTLGPDHPETLAARQEMGYVLGQLGRHADAHQVYTAVLAARERTMGADHPDTLRCRHNLAFALGRLGRLAAAYRMAREVAEARARVLGPEHPDTLVTRYEVAYVLGQLGRWAEALDTYREVAEARARVLGPDHPDTLAARYETGISLGRLGRSEEALALYRELIEDRARVHGPEHPETLRARHGLGVNLGRLVRWEEALAESREVCAIRVRVLGPRHPDTLVSRREVAVALGWLGRWDEALTEYRAVADARERVLGPGHPDTLTSREDEAHCLKQLGRTTQADELHRRVEALRQAARTP